MKTQTAKGGQNDKKLIILGFVSIAILFLIYSRFESQDITPDAVQSIERLGMGFYVLFTISIGMIGIGLRKFQKRIAATGNTTVLSMICSNTLDSRAKKTFVVTFIVYGIFFSMTSGILVYQPEVVFSYHYGADVPSAHITPCCGVHCMSHVCGLIFVIVHRSNKCSCVYNCNNRITNAVHCYFNTDFDLDTISHIKKNNKISE